MGFFDLAYLSGHLQTMGDEEGVEKQKESKNNKVKFKLNMSIYSQPYRIILCKMELLNVVWLIWDHYRP